MSNIEKYEQYCELLTKLNDKEQELKEVTALRNKMVYERDSLRRDIEDFERGFDVSEENLKSIRVERLNKCLHQPVSYAKGGGIDGDLVSEFKKSEDYSEFDRDEKKLFRLLIPELKYRQYNIQNAILVGESDSEDFDVYESVIIENYIDEIMSEIEDEHDLSVKELKQIKKIIYIFVEYVSNI